MELASHRLSRDRDVHAIQVSDRADDRNPVDKKPANFSHVLLRKTRIKSTVELHSFPRIASITFQHLTRFQCNGRCTEILQFCSDFLEGSGVHFYSHASVGSVTNDAQLQIFHTVSVPLRNDDRLII